MGNHSFFSGILDIRSSLLGVGLVCSVTSEGIESFIAQVGGGVVRSIGCDTLDALAFYSQTTLVPLTICIGSFGPSGSAFFIVVDGAFFFAATSFRAGGFLVGGDFAGCHFRAGGYVVVIYNTILGHVDFIHIQLAGNSQGTANGNVASGCQGTGLDISGFHCAVGLDKTAACIEAFNSCFSCFQGAADFSANSGFQGTRFQLGAGNLASFDSAGTYIQLGAGNLAAFDIAGTYIQLLAGDIAIVINNGCTVTDIDATIGIYFETTIGCAELSVTSNTKFSISYVQSTICFYISGSSIHCEFAAGPFDGTVSIESRFSISRRIAAGKYAIRCNNGTVRAHFDTITVHGDPIISIYVQHQFIHRRGCGAVVADFGNPAVVAHFEIILGIDFDLLIQVK